MDKTFSLQVKDELTRLELGGSCCARWELLGALRAGAVLEARRSGGLQLTMTTESPSVARRAFLLFKNVLGLNAKIVRQPRRVRLHDSYSVQVNSQPGLKESLIRLGFLQADPPALGSTCPRRDCCRRAYLRGLFLGAGSITNPARSYHLELLIGSRRQAAYLVRLLMAYRLRAGKTERKGRQIVYLKEGDAIASFLTIIGAVTSRLEFENVRVIKGMRNRVNRLVNFETANLDKTVAAACRQQDAIRLLVAAIGLDNLPEPLKEMARLRLEYPEATLRELGQQLDPPLSKSGVNHRLRKLEQMARELAASKKEVFQ